MADDTVADSTVADRTVADRTVADSTPYTPGADGWAIAIEPPRQSDVIALLEANDAFALSLYPPEFCFLLDVDELEAPGVTVFVARDPSAPAVGMAALVDHGDGSAELKRMFVTAAARGRGVASGILRVVERYASESGVDLIQLETGPKQLEAIALYERFGYHRIPGFGDYTDLRYSLCYEKPLPAPETQDFRPPAPS